MERWLLGRAYSLDPDAYRRARLCGALVLLGLFASSAVAGQRLVLGEALLALLPSGGLALELSALWALRQGRVRVVSHLICAGLVATIALNNVLTAGQLPAAFMGASAVIVLVMLLSGPRGGAIWGALLGASLGVAALWWYSGTTPIIAVPRIYRETQWFPIGIGAYLLTLLGALVYEQLRTATLADLERAKRAADAAAVAKGEFLATMSHEIRTPLNGVHGVAQLLVERPLDDTSRALAQSMLKSSNALLDVINGILDFSKLDAGAVVLEHADFDLRTLCQESLVLFRFGSKRDAVALRLNYAGPVPCPVRGDPTRLRQVLTNLLGNALKFTEAGSVTLHARVDPHDAHSMRVRLGVRDTGIGIALEAQQNLFEHFSQADSTTTRKYGGTGLGLAISQRLVRLMGGEMSVASHPGQGSDFHFTLTMERSETGSVPNNRSTTRPSGAALSGHVLVAEDNPVNRMVIRRMLQGLGLEVAVAEDGVRALDLAATRAYDCILMDVMMPRMDGYDCCRSIRALAQHRRTPIIALTANAFASDRERCLSAGMDDFLAKPVERHVLQRTLERWVLKDRGQDSPG